jgi:hypothetical protein
VDETRDVIRMVSVWQIVHVKIAGNFAAHGLGKEAVKQIKDQVLKENFISCISDIVLLEQTVLFLLNE